MTTIPSVGAPPKPPACTCMAWEDQIKKINGPIELSQIRAGRSLPADHFIAWHFCPWCGRSLLPPVVPEGATTREETVPPDFEGLLLAIRAGEREQLMAEQYPQDHERRRIARVNGSHASAALRASVASLTSQLEAARQNLDAEAAPYTERIAQLESDNETLCERTAALTSDVEQLKGEITDWREREAACCPEDVGFEEMIRSLKKWIHDLESGVVPDTSAAKIRDAALREAAKAAQEHADRFFNHEMRVSGSAASEVAQVIESLRSSPSPSVSPRADETEK